MRYDVKKDDLPPDLKELVEIVGFQNVINLVESRGGEAVYFPKPEKIERAARDRIIRGEFDGTNHKELARRHNLSIVWIRKIVNNS